MNKFLTFAGTQPVYLGDIDFMQDAAADAIKQLAKALMGADSDSFNAILQGVELQWNSSTLTITPGVVVLNGELLPFEGATLESPGSLYFHIESTLSGDRTFKDGESHQCHETRKAIINTTSTGGIIVGNVPRLHDDKVYDYEIISGIVTDAKLIKKSGFWFLKIDVDSTSSQSTGGSVRFQNLPAEFTSAIEGFAAPAPIVLSDGNGNSAIQSMKCTAIVDVLGTSFLLSLAGEQVTPGEGQYNTMLPIY